MSQASSGSNAILDQTIHDARVRLSAWLDDGEALAQVLQNPSMQNTIRSLQENISQPFLFVVIGEVKAGKSSFVNALLSSDICDVGADPRTNVVTKIVHANGEPYSIDLKPGMLKEIGRPVPILQQIAIVDTPGTNSPFIQHEEITKEFIPNSDLVLFVFFAKNPYTNTAWELLDFTQGEWHKPTVFVLQQADITDPVELETAYAYVRQEAEKRGIESPRVFATSAKLELNGQSAESGFDPIRAFVRDTITAGQGYRLKLQSSMGSAQQILARLSGDVEGLKQQVNLDRTVVERIQGRLTQGQSKSRYELDSLVERLLAQYDRIAAQIKSDFREGLTVFVLAKRSIVGIFNRQERVEPWMNKLKERSKKELETALEETSREGAKHFVGGIQQLIRRIVEDLNTLQNTELRTTEISVPILEHRYAVIEDVKGKVSNLLSDEAFLDFMAAKAESVGPGIASGGLLAIVGGTIAAVTEVVILDILGSVFLGLGVVLAGGILITKRRAMIQKFERELDRNQERFRATVSEQLEGQLGVIYEEIDRSLIDLYQYVDQQDASIVPLLEQYAALKQRADALAVEIQQL